ncbi:TPA: hypothetical protein ACGBUC_003404 [Klebsiella variicola]|uniref:hypothetical protein n=1 Tax=Klebsiella TaxID=570 RepID=UPI000942EA37|nr:MULTISPECIES: hypothetical protein [Klebsiella]PJR50281.1 hypothetical protein CWM58_12775 [Klebsiella sp. H-Nf2]PJX31285.1 hypothetical protein CWM53_16170 [Klebsiella sp. A-Nf5]PJX36123.1 hypothetical protein CWM59_18800 [Klebsiella sp. B-Nf7]PJX48497.1 hypothetical protein CWM60_09910 [Klebsiella sp. C1-16S-Nf17]QHW96333.1 hypothetical protein GZS05_07770 [Klebsiella variicola]
MKEHPDKHIRAAIARALAEGWIVIPAGRSSHCFARLICGIAEHRQHMMSIWSTPASPENHARQIIRMIERCSLSATDRITHTHKER